MRGARALAIVIAALVALLGFAGTAFAQPKLSDLIDQLKNNDDYRVRTQAALALGASGEDGAVSPLCSAITSDSNVSVQVASAAALGKLGKPSGLTCLQGLQGKISQASVKAQIEKSIASLQGSSGGSSAPGAGTKYYVAIQVTNKTNRSASDIDSVVRSAIVAKLQGKGGYAIAPKSETPAQAGSIVKGKMKGFKLVVAVDQPVYSGSDVGVTLHVSMFDYPNSALKAEFTPKGSTEAQGKDDKEGEKLIIKDCAERAADSFAKVAASL